MMTVVSERSSVVQAFIEGAVSGAPIRCAAVVAPGGYGKTVLAQEVVAACTAVDVSVVFVAGDLADADSKLESVDGGVVVIDDADDAPGELLERARSLAIDATTTQSVVVFARSVSSSPALAALCALADQSDSLEDLAGLELAELGSKIPKSSELTATDLDELTGAVPALVDRLCAGWDDEGWPAEMVTSFEQLPKRFRRHVEVEFSQVGDDDRQALASAAMMVVATPDGAIEVDGQSAGLGLVGLSGQMPRAVGYAIEPLLSDTERQAAISEVAQSLIHTDPARASGLFEQIGAPELAAVAYAAAGHTDAATKALRDRPVEGAAAAASAHVAGTESRWNAAADLIDKVGSSHPYWSDSTLHDARSLYAAIAHANEYGPAANSFSSTAAQILQRTLAATTASERADLVDELRALVRQAKNQPPILDVAVTGAELASMAAVTLGEFDLARAMLDATPESPQRSSLTAALHTWISVRTGDATTESMGETPSTVSADTLRLAAQLIDARRASDGEAVADTVTAIAGLVAQMSVDVLTFDALCEVHVGAHRADARKQAQQVGDGLDRFVDQRTSPLLQVRLAWSRVEAAVASGDADAVSAQTSAFAAVEGVSELAPVLLAAAQQWAAIYRGQLDADAIRSAISGLEVAGYVWEAAALAGQAAIRVDDGAVAKELLALGREFRAESAEPKIISPAGLSDREIEIGLLVLKGHSYKEIGAECFISPKTVEHHVSHIRQKLVAVGVPRAEFRAKLQADLQPD